MKKVWIDFRQPMSPNVRTLRILIFFLGTVVLCYSLYGYQRANTERTTLAWELQSSGRMDGRDTHQALGVSSQGQSLESFKPANDVLLRLNLPWNTIFSALEQTLSPDISLLSLEPDPGKTSITIKARAKNIAAAFDYLDRLQATKSFTGVHLLSQDLVDETEHLPVEFTLTANWVNHP